MQIFSLSKKLIQSLFRSEGLQGKVIHKISKDSPTDSYDEFGIPIDTTASTTIKANGVGMASIDFILGDREQVKGELELSLAIQDNKPLYLLDETPVTTLEIHPFTYKVKYFTKNMTKEDSEKAPFSRNSQYERVNILFNPLMQIMKGDEFIDRIGQVYSIDEVAHLEEVTTILYCVRL